MAQAGTQNRKVNIVAPINSAYAERPEGCLGYPGGTAQTFGRVRTPRDPAYISSSPIMKKLALIFILLALSSCNFRAKADNTSLPNAVYFVHGQGELSSEDLQAHPEIVVVQTFDDFKKYASRKTALWIDKNAISFVNMDWLHQAPQKYYPLALVGYNDALYSFRETLSGFPISGPAINWSTATLEPGFSVWMIREETSSSISTYMMGYAQPPSVDAILRITNALLKGGPPK